MYTGRQYSQETYGAKNLYPENIKKERKRNLLQPNLKK